MINNKKIKVIATIVMAIGILSFVFIRFKNIVISEEDANETVIDIYNSKIIGGELIDMLIQPNSDWSELPLSKHFKKKFNNKYGVLGNIKADKIELDPYQDGRFPFDEYSYILVTKRLKQTAYIYHLDEKNRVYDDFWIVHTYEITDEHGNKMDMMSKIEEKNFAPSFMKLADGYRDEESVGVTENFKKKYTYFLGLFIHYSGLDFNKIEFVSEKSSWKKKEAYFQVWSQFEDKMREYIVRFKLDKRGYLDDATAELQRVTEYDGYTRFFRNSRVFYKNSNWERVPMTENFRKKFSPEKGVFPDIDQVDFLYDRKSPHLLRLRTSIGDSGIIIDGNFLKNKHIHYYLAKWITIKMNNETYLDDVIYKKLDYIDMDAFEVKKLYMKYLEEKGLTIEEDFEMR